MYSTGDEYVMIKPFWSQDRKVSKLGLRVKIRVFVLHALRHMGYHRVRVAVSSVLSISTTLLKAVARWSPDVSGKVLGFLHVAIGCMTVTLTIQTCRRLLLGAADRWRSDVSGKHISF